MSAEIVTRPILAFDEHRHTNGDLIAHCAQLGRIVGIVVDPTYGRGGFWTRHRPEQLLAFDLDPRCGVTVANFRRLPLADMSVDTVVFDPPYKLNGTSTGDGPSALDDRYGVTRYMPWPDRHQLIRDGITEAVRVLRRDGWLLVKCQDQVSSGRVRWQTSEFARRTPKRSAVVSSTSSNCSVGVVSQTVVVRFTLDAITRRCSSCVASRRRDERAAC